MSGCSQRECQATWSQIVHPLRAKCLATWSWTVTLLRARCLFLIQSLNVWQLKAELYANLCSYNCLTSYMPHIKCECVYVWHW